MTTFGSPSPEFGKRNTPSFVSNAGMSLTLQIKLTQDEARTDQAGDLSCADPITRHPNKNLLTPW
jgi:hypothetical protein